MALTDEAIYFQLGQLVAEMPDLATGPITREMMQWMGRAVTLVELVDPSATLEIIELKTACRHLDSSIRYINAQTIAMIATRLLQKPSFAHP
jgi:hypothetical protein